MRAVIQRVSEASVSTGSGKCGKIGKGLVVLLGVERGDTVSDAEALASKTARLRIFTDGDGKMNLSLSDVGGSLLVISNFTLISDYSHGNRPSYFGAEEPEAAEMLYNYFCITLKNLGYHVETGVFGADMQVKILNDGPVTIVMDSALLKKKK
ncbi:MAG: D-tyrosyl-tRNA(Tyr) deacylase [Clostridia bacterium]|nr:D-tyrosyl-tRNA(Tyr) deacylase [Clostridia bacterium]